MGQRDPIELITEDDIQNGVDKVGGFISDIQKKIQTTFAGGGGGGGATTTTDGPQMGPEPFDYSQFIEEGKALDDSKKIGVNGQKMAKRICKNSNKRLGLHFHKLGKYWINILPIERPDWNKKPNPN